MAYRTRIFRDIIPVSADLTSAADVFEEEVQHDMIIHRVEFIITTTVAADNTAPVISFDYSPAGSNRTEWGTATIADTSDVSTHVAITVASAQEDPLDIADGDQIHYEVKTAAADAGAAAGAGYFVVYYEIVPDVEIA